MVMRLEGLAIALACLGAGWLVASLIRRLGWEPRWAGRGRVTLHRRGDSGDASEGRWRFEGDLNGFRGPPDDGGSGGASGSF